MVNPSCPTLGTKKDKTWTYDEYYVGERDEEKRKDGQGTNHWTGAKSIEWYTGHLLRDTMHGAGVYRWRHLGRDGTHFSYEGHFYCNQMHGYGVMSYPDGNVFTGLFHSNSRWGPGVESQACLREDVGLWRGKQLVRLVWRPAMPSIAPDLYASNVGKACVDPHRIMLAESYKRIGDTNSALDLLKQCGTEPRQAIEKWNKLYSNHCTDLKSPLCYVEAFERDYYKGRIDMLEEISCLPENREDLSQDSKESPHNFTVYYAWNNNRATVHMMQHSYMHEVQRDSVQLNLAEVLSGPRKQFKPAGKHELDCRSLMMASFLGQTQTVVELVNNIKIHPDIADCLGNSAVMYATCGDQVKIIHFLVEAGANVNSFNDSCCTPLTVALLRFTCAQKDISPSGMFQAVLPPPVAPPPVAPNVFEWNFSHDQVLSVVAGGIPRTASKLSKSAPSTKRIRSSGTLTDLPSEKTRKKIDASSSPKPPVILEHTSEDSISEDKKIYNAINGEFEIRINDLFSRQSGVNPVTYLFEVNDMVKETEASDEEPKKAIDKNPKKAISKQLKDTMKPSKEMIWQGADKDEYSSIDSIEKQKNEMLSRIMLTILQLLCDGADPNLVKCPQPALFIAIISGNADLVKHLVNYGANINESYKQIFGYTPLDLAVSREFTLENLEMIRAILECGAITSHRLQYGDDSTADAGIPKNCGPTLLHTVLARKTDNDVEEEIRLNVLEILLEYNCNPLIQFKGRSAVDVAMTKSMELFDIFIKSPTTNLNAPINDLNQNALVKMFSLPFFKTVIPLERLQTLTNLLLYGADPLIECMNGSEKFANIFVFAMKTLVELEATQIKSNPATSPNKNESKKSPPPPKKETLSNKSMGKLGVDDLGDYKQALDLVTECARLLHVRWLQAKLVKELVEVIDKYKHRQWNMILKEHNRKKATGLWLTTQRCLEVWDILKQTRRKVYRDERVLKHLLYIVQYYNRMNKIVPSMQPTAEQKSSIEFNISYLIKERHAAAKLSTDMGTWKKPYVKPEMTSTANEEKFNICFECALPFEEQKIRCVSCKLVAFCSLECMKINIDRVNCHPCSSYLKMKYFPSPPESGTHDFISSV